MCARFRKLENVLLIIDLNQWHRMKTREIGCIILSEPFLFPEDLWIPLPSDVALSIQTGKRYFTEEQTGRQLWGEVTERLQLLAAARADVGPTTIAAIESPRCGNPMPIRPRLGQGAFRE